MYDTASFFKEIMDLQVYALAIALYLVGMALRKTSKVNSKYIPILLTVLGVIFILLYIFSTNDLLTFKDVCGAIFSAFVQGVLCAAVAVYANQIFKQLVYSEEKDKEDNSNNEEEIITDRNDEDQD
jgi:uncharacterized BrkB/YihY/UPF0761 family membrane protein